MLGRYSIRPLPIAYGVLRSARTQDAHAEVQKQRAALLDLPLGETNGAILREFAGNPSTDQHHENRGVCEHEADLSPMEWIAGEHCGKHVHTQ